MYMYNQLNLRKISEILNIFWNAGLYKASSQRFVFWQFQLIASQYLPNILLWQ